MLLGNKQKFTFGQSKIVPYEVNPGRNSLNPRTGNLSKVICFRNNVLRKLNYEFVICIIDMSNSNMY